MPRFHSPYLLSLKKPRYTKPLQSPQKGPLRRELPVSEAFFYMSFELLIKFLLIKEIYYFSQRP